MLFLTKLVDYPIMNIDRVFFNYVSKKTVRTLCKKYIFQAILGILFYFLIEINLKINLEIRIYYLMYITHTHIGENGY